MPRKSEAWDASRKAVAFPAEDMTAGASVVCAISEEALVGHFGARPSDATSLVDAFRRYRPAIERAASRKYDSGPRSALVMLDGADFSGTPPTAD